MVDAGLLANKKKLINTTLQSILTFQLESEEKAKAVMTSMGLSVAIEGEEAQTVQLTDKKLEQAVVSGVLTEAQAKELAMTVGVTVAQNAQATSTMPKWIANMKAMTIATLEQVAATAKWLATNPVGWATLAAIGIATAIYSYKKHEKELEKQKQKIKELGEEARNEFKSIKDELQSSTDTVDEVGKKYAEFAQKVGNLGTLNQNQGSLSNDDYQEFLDISKQLANLYPQLTTGYDENGNAILNLNGDVQTITSSLYDMVDAQKAVANQELKGQMGDIYSDFLQTQDESTNKYNDLLNRINNLDNIDWNKLTIGDLSSEFDYIFKETGLDLSYMNITDPIHSIGEENVQAIHTSYTNLLQEYNSELDTLKKNISSENKNFSTYVTSLVETDATYLALDNNKKRIVSSIISNADYDTLLSGHNEDWDEAYSQEIEDNILNAIRDIDDTKVINALIVVGITDNIVYIFAFDNLI